MSLDRWFGFECFGCAVMADFRMTEEQSEGLRFPLKTSEPRAECPLCREFMTFKGTWTADASGYGSRGDLGARAAKE